MKAPRLVRTRGGLVIHRVNCRYTNIHNATPWYWADGRDIDLLLIVAENHGLRICRVCRPLEESP